MGKAAKDIVPAMGLRKELVVTPDQVELIKRTVAKGATDDELKLFVYDCQRRGVHPLDRMIFFIKRRQKTGRKDSSGKDIYEEKATHQCSIDYFRSEGESTGEYDGQDEPEYGSETNEGFPKYAKINIYRKGIDRPFVGMARWKEYYPGEKLGFMWRRMPYGQLAKCAEAIGFRKAFPKKFDKLYVDEETQRIDVIDVTPTKTESVKSLTKKKALEEGVTANKGFEDDLNKAPDEDALNMIWAEIEKKDMAGPEKVALRRVRDTRAQQLKGELL